MSYRYVLTPQPTGRRLTMAEARDRRFHDVLYHPPGQPALLPSLGVIVEVGREYVFVRYSGEPNAKATRAADLELANCTLEVEQV